jgi:predicted metallopeptidase
MTHNLKIHPNYFKDVFLNLKKVEVRLNDRNYQENDILVLNEFEPLTEKYTGIYIIRKVDYVIKDVAGLAPDYVILQISKLL